MNSLEEGFIRRSLKPRVDCDIPGRLRFSFTRYALLPEAAKPYLHYVEDVLKLLPGVPPEDMIEMAIEKSWRGFKAEWYTNATKKTDVNNKPNSDLYDRIHETGEGRHYVSTL